MNAKALHINKVIIMLSKQVNKKSSFKNKPFDKDKK